MSRTKIQAPAASGQSEAENTEPLHVKYRPKTFKDVIGQDHVVASIKDALKAKARPHAWLFTGAAGTGKTTLARILTKEFGVAPANIIEVDAAANSGVDATRDLLGPLRYQGFGDASNKAIILDEAHMLSKQAWASLLKTVEEPPAHVYFFFCTTEEGKVPPAIVTRCMAYSLKSVRYDDLMDLLEDVCHAEGLDTPERVLSLVARSCEGSPRQALTMLAKVQGCRDEDEAQPLLDTALENAEVIKLCQLLIRGELTWPKLVATLKAMPEMPAESVRIIVSNYMAGCAMNAKTDKEATRILDIMAPFSKPYAASDKLAPLLLSFGAYIFD